MTQDPSDVQAVVQSASRRPWLPAAERRRGPALDRRAIEDLIPHRDPFLFLDGITCVDTARRLIVCRRDLRATDPVFAGHFPQRPVWPGVLQVEAIGQAGLCLRRLTSAAAGAPSAAGLALTHILSARFLRPILPDAPVEIVARQLADGLFTVLVGQCLQHDAVCSVAAVQGISQEAGA